MKYIGFIKEYDKIPEALLLNDYINHDGGNYNIDKNLLIAYLKNGQVALSWMGVFIDFENNNYISPHIYYTDGKWIWPSYLIYYLENKLNFYLKKDFLDYLMDKKYIYESISKEKLMEIEHDFMNKIEFSYK